MQDEAHTDRPVLPLVWRIVLVTVATLLIWVGGIQFSTFLFGIEMSLQKHITNAVGVGVLAVLLVLVFRRYVDRRPVSTLGLDGGKQAARDFFYGALTWLIPAAVGLTAALLLGWVDVQINSSVGETLGAAMLLVVLVFVYEAFPEEFIFRGYIYRNLTDRIAPWGAVVIQALLFCAFGTALSGIMDGWEASIFVERSTLFFVMDLVIGALRVISGSLWTGIGFHVAFQVAMQMFLNSNYVDITVSDEGMFTLVTAALAFIAATTVAGLFWRGKANWTTPEPDTSSASGSMKLSAD